MSKVTALYLGAEVEDRLWFPVRKMIWHGEKYHTGCVGGVKELIAAMLISTIDLGFGLWS